MNKAELLEALKDYPDDMQIRVYADHGQCYYKAQEVASISVLDQEEYEADVVCEGDLEDYCDKVIVIYS